MATNIGTIELVARIDTSQYKKGASEVANANREIESSTGSVDKSTESTNSGLISLAKNGLKIAAVGVAGLGAAVAGMTLQGGFARALNIEDAQAKLRGLGHDATTVKTIMNNAIASVKGTAFGLDAAATTAANAVASGIKPGQQLEQVLKTVANTAALAGTDMSTLGAIFNKVAASNKVQMDVINQLHDAGVPALALLAKEIGKTAEETASMASDGQINFATFERAMRNGVGNAALEMGNTVRGSLANMRAAFSRAGAVIADKILPHLKDAIQGITGWVDTVAKRIPSIIDTIVKQFGGLRDALGSASDGISNSLDTGNYESLGQRIGSIIAAGINASLSQFKLQAHNMKEWFADVDWVSIGISIGKGAVGFVVGFVLGLLNTDITGIFRSLANNWVEVLMGVLAIALAPTKLINPITKAIGKIPFAGPLLNKVIGAIRSLLPMTRSAFGSLFTGTTGVIRTGITRIGMIFKTLGQILVAPFRIADEQIGLFVRLLPNTINQAFMGIINMARTALTTFITVIQSIFTGVWTVITTILRPLSAFFGNLFRGIWTNIQGIFTGIGEWFYMRFLSAQLAVQQGFASVVGWFGARWADIRGIFGGVSGWFGGVFSAASNAVRGAFNGITGFFSGLWNNIVSIFGQAGTRVGDAIGGAVRGALNSVLRGAINIINGFIRSINGVTGEINKIPGVNIGKLGELNVPQLAKGGIITSPTLAMIGEGNESEAVIPLSKLDKMMNNTVSTGGQPVQITINLDGIMTRSKADVRAVAKQLVGALNEELKAKGHQVIGGGAI